MRRPVRLGFIVVAVAAAAVAVWVAVEVGRAAYAGRQLQTDVASAAAHVRAVDLEALALDLDVVQQSAVELESATSGAVWDTLAKTPLVGSTANSAQLLARAAVGATSAGDRLKPLVEELAADELQRADGSIDATTLAQLGEALVATAADLEDSAGLADRTDPEAIGPVGEAATTTRQLLADLPQQVRTAGEAAGVIAGILGAGGDTSTLVLMQNGSEARGTGGFIGAYALVDAVDGATTVRTVDTNNSLSTPIPNDDMPADFLHLWDDRDTAEWNSYNQTRHFPYIGHLSAQGMAARGTPVDTVVAIDAYAVAALLAGTGPITAEGHTVDSATAVEFFNRTVYEVTPDVATKDRVVVGLMTALMDRITAGQLDLPATVEAMAPVVDQERVRLWSADPAKQEQLERWSVGGVVPDSPGPWVAVALNNSAGNKLDAYLSSSVLYRANTCGTGPSTVTVTLTNDAPPNGTTYAYSQKYLKHPISGTTRMMVDVYGPVGAEWKSAVLDGERQYVFEGSERRRPVWVYDMVLTPGQTSTLRVTFREPKSTASAVVSPQAMAIPQATTTVSACSADSGDSGS